MKRTVVIVIRRSCSRRGVAMSKRALAEALATRANLKNLLRTRPNECMHDRSLAQHEL